MHTAAHSKSSLSLVTQQGRRLASGGSPCSVGRKAKSLHMHGCQIFVPACAAGFPKFEAGCRSNKNHQGCTVAPSLPALLLAVRVAGRRAVLLTPDIGWEGGRNCKTARVAHPCVLLCLLSLPTSLLLPSSFLLLFKEGGGRWAGIGVVRHWGQPFCLPTSPFTLKRMAHPSTLLHLQGWRRVPS